MDKKILKIAKEKFRELSKKYDGFINLIVDDWRGYRFIFDTEDVRKCNSNCQKCPLFLLLRNEKRGIFSSGLCRATKKDQSIFGSQFFLNCKTLEQYKDCYVNFLLKEANTEKKIEAELELIDSCKVIFSKEQDLLELEKNIKNSILSKVFLLADKRKKKIMRRLMG